MNEKPRIIVILGPTAVGKTEHALNLAAEFEGEIISADSMQVYRHLDIGTSKPTSEERERVPHHLIDIVDPDGEFNAAVFRSLAENVIGCLRGKNKRIFVVGGTGLYIRALAGGLIDGPGPGESRRKRFRASLEKEDAESLHDRLMQRDPRAAGRIHPHDRVRITRALEIAELTGEPISEKQLRHGFQEARYECLKIGFYRDREELYRRIDRRAERMVDDGLVAETEQIIRMGYRDNLKPLQSLGYRYFMQYISNKLPLKDAVNFMQRDTRHYARRQMTWFRKESGIHWFHPDESDAVRGKIDAFLRRGEDAPEGPPIA